MTFLFYTSILLLIAALSLTFLLLRKKKKRTFAVQRVLVLSALFCALVLLGTFIRGYFFFDHEQYGIKYNQERLRLGADTIPRNFRLINGPIKGWTDYFEKQNIYRLVYQSNGIASGHFRKEVDVGEDGPGRELDFYLKRKDTIITTFIYLNKSKSTDTVSAPNISLLQ